MQQASFKGLGLKAKVLLGLSAFLVLTIATTLIFSNHLLTNDKKAYIFENVLNSTEDIKKIILERIQFSLLQGESLIQIARFDREGAEKLFRKQKFIEALTYHEGNKVLYQFAREEFPEFSEQFPEKVRTWLETEIIGVEQGGKLTMPFKDNVLEFSFNSEGRTLRVLINMNILWSRISGDAVFKYLVLSKDTVLWESTSATPKALGQLLSTSGSSISKEVSINGEKLLASAAVIPDYDIKIISYISSEKAYSVVNDLAIRIIGFGLIILGLSLVSGIIFSTHITNPINLLMKGAEYIAKGDFDHQVEVKSRDELSVLSNQFNFMGGKIKNLLDEKEMIIVELKEAKAKIEDYSRNLEVKVQERTAELKAARDFIQTMVDSIDQGLFVIDKDLNCLPIFTRACNDLFGKSPAENTYAEVLNLNEEENSRIGMWADILFNEKIPFDSAVGLGISEKISGNPESEDFKVLKLNYYPIRNEDGGIVNVVTVATDKTNEVRAIEESRKQQKFVEMIFKILGSKSQFMDLDKEIEDYLRALDENFETQEPDLNKAMLIYHTFTGGLGMYAVDHLVTLSRKNEQSIVDMKKDQNIDLEVLRKEKELFKDSYHKFRTDTFELLGFKSQMKEVDFGVILYLADLVNSTDNKELKHIYNEHFMKVPIEQFLFPYKDLLVSLGMKLNKEFAPLEIKGGDVRVSPDQFREFFSLLVHLIRNCADHGIEPAHQRLEKQKSSEGKIKINCHLENSGKTLKVVVEDDGRGIDPKKIKTKLSEKHSDQYINESDERVIYHIFDSDFSTAEQVTTISGRGVGMSAIKDVVDRLHGKITLISKIDQGTRFIFELPVA